MSGTKPGYRLYIEIGVVLLLVAIALTVYFTLQRRVAGRGEGLDYTSNRSLREAIYHYRLGEDERAELLLLNALRSLRKKRDRSMALLYLGNIAHRRGDEEKALSYYGEAEKADGKNYFAPYNAAVVSTRRGEWRRALDYVREVVKLNPEYAPGRILLANILYGAGRLEEARRMYEPLVAEDTTATYNLATLLYREGDVDRALSLYSSLLEGEETPDAIDGLAHIACALILQKTRPLDSIRHMMKARETFPTSPVADADLALLYLREGNDGEAADLLESIRPESLGGSVLDMYGMALFRAGRYLDAAEVYTSLSGGGGKESLILGDIHHRLGQDRRAEEDYRAALDVASGEQRRAAFHNLLTLLREKRRFDEMLDLCRRFKDVPGLELDTALCEGDVSFRTGRLSAARDAMERAHLLVGDDPEGLMKIADVYLRNDRFNNAMDVLTRIRGIDSDRVNERIALLYHRMGQEKRAAEVLRRITEETGDLDLYYRSALLLASLSDQEEAHSVYLSLISDFPDRFEAYHNDALLSIAQGHPGAAVETLQEAIAHCSSADATSLARLYTVMGTAFYERGDLDSAAHMFSRAVTLDGSNETARLNLRTLGDAMKEGNGL